MSIQPRARRVVRQVLADGAKRAAALTRGRSDSCPGARGGEWQRRRDRRIGLEGLARRLVRRRLGGYFRAGDVPGVQVHAGIRVPAQGIRSARGRCRHCPTRKDARPVILGRFGRHTESPSENTQRQPSISAVSRPRFRAYEYRPFSVSKGCRLRPTVPSEPRQHMTSKAKSDRKRVALYLRVSTTNGQTTENQRRELVAAAKRHRWQVVTVFEDAGLSGAKGREGRPGLDAMMAAIGRREFDVVATWSVDSIGRSLRDLVTFLGKSMANGLTCIFTNRGSTPLLPPARRCSA